MHTSKAQAVDFYLPLLMLLSATSLLAFALGMMLGFAGGDAAELAPQSMAGIVIPALGLLTYGCLAYFTLRAMKVAWLCRSPGLRVKQVGHAKNA